MSRTRIAVTAGLATALIAASGCGGSAKTLTRADFVAKANDICRRANEKRPMAEKHLATLAAYEKVGLDQLHGLAPPASLKDDWAQILAYDDTLVQDTSLYAEYSATYNKRALQALLASVRPVLSSMEKITKGDELSDCEQFR